jgi:hypothetical protein
MSGEGRRGTEKKEMFPRTALSRQELSGRYSAACCNGRTAVRICMS